MNWYREYQTEWKEIIETVARELGRSEQMVEKDTIQSMFLFEQNMQDRDSRHLYDICKLLQEVELNEELDKLIDMVRDDRMQSKKN